MTLDELERKHAALKPTYSERVIELGPEWGHIDIEEDQPTKAIEQKLLPPAHSQYDIAFGVEVVSLLQGICPNCSDPVVINVDYTAKVKNVTYFDCEFDSRHRWMVMHDD